MEHKNKHQTKRKTNFRYCRFLTTTGAMLIWSLLAGTAFFFYVKYHELLYLVITILIVLIGVSNLAGNIIAKAVRNESKKENHH
ncbi:MAG: hypothetical protein JW881_10660 [Spirochaetales bacterium]|nr:hypothetical protein [Spirochaetales bacterium]